jgi:peptide/nickel transport system ATP-binding protein
LVGESGCGKSTLGNAILLLDKATADKFYIGQDITQLNSAATKALRKEIKSFSGSLFFIKLEKSVGKAIMEPMKVHGLYKDDKERRAKLLKF